MTNTKQAFTELIDCTEAMAKQGQLEAFFRLILTLEEQNTLAMRYQIIKALLPSQQVQRDIAKQLGVSIAKITRGSNSLKIIDQSLKNKLKQHLGED